MQAKATHKLFVYPFDTLLRIPQTRRCNTQMKIWFLPSTWGSFDSAYSSHLKQLSAKSKKAKKVLGSIILHPECFFDLQHQVVVLFW